MSVLMIFFTFLFSLCSYAEVDNLGSGLLIQTNYQAEVYFDRRFFSLRDDGIYPDLKAHDQTYTCFVSYQSPTPTPISILKDKEAVFSTTIPAISNTDRYILTIDPTENHLEKISLDTIKNTSVVSAQNISLCLLSLALGVFIGFRIKRSSYFITGLPTTKQIISSQLILYNDTEEIFSILLSHSERQHIVFVGSDPNDWNRDSAFGHWFFVEEDELHTIKRHIDALQILEQPIYVYTHPRYILDIDTTIRDSQNQQLQQFLHEHPKNVLVFVPRDIDTSLN